MKVACLVLGLVASCSAFTAGAAVRPALARTAAPARTAGVVAYTEPEAQDLWWGDKEYPPSEVLGIGKDVPSLVYGITAPIALFIGLWCVADSNLLNILSGSNINGWRTAGAMILPIYSWGLHVEIGRASCRERV